MTIRYTGLRVLSGNGVAICRLVNALPAAGASVGEQVILTTDRNVYEWDGAVWNDQGDASPTGGGGVSDGDKGDVVVSGGGTVWTVDANAVTNAKLADMATARIKGRVTAGSGDPEDLTGTQATTLLDVFTSGLKGLAPASGGGTSNFLRADGTWSAPGGASVSHSFSTATIAESSAVLVSRYAEIAAGQTLEISTDADLEIT